MAYLDPTALAVALPHPQPGGRAPAEAADQALIHVMQAHLFLRVLEQRALRIEPALAALGASRQAIEALDGHVPTTRFLAFLRTCHELSGDPNLGLHAGSSVRLADLELLGLLLRSCQDGNDAYQVYRRYRAVRPARGDLGVRVGKDEISVGLVRSSWHTPRLLIDCLLARSLRCIQLLAGKAPLLRVHFSYRPPASTHVHEALFQCALLFEQEKDELVFSSDLLRQKLPNADAEVVRTLDAHLSRQPPSRPQTRDLPSVVLTLISEELTRGRVSLSTVAGQLGLSERTLRRQLKEAGTSYQELLDDVRRELAMSFLRDAPEGSAVQLSQQLGFSEPAAFYRAFKRWTGRTWSSCQPGQ